MTDKERYINALKEVLEAQELYYDTSKSYPIWWCDSNAESLEYAANAELDSLNEKEN